MIDTISFKCNWPLKVTSHSDWRFVSRIEDIPVPQGQETGGQCKSFTATHYLCGIYLRGSASRIKLVKVSLPRLVHGDNADLIESQQQIDEALNCLLSLLEEIADTSTPLQHFTRVDLCWQFRHSPAALIRAHRHCVFPRCQPSKREFGDYSAAWEYHGKRIIIYDKKLKRTRIHGDVARVEVQLSKEPLLQYLGHGDAHVTRLNFAQCYQAYRTLLITFASSVFVTSPGTIYETLALMEGNALSAGLESPVESYISSLNPRTARDWRRRITAANLRRENFRWEDILPESGPPDPTSAS